MLEAINIASAKAQDDRELPFPKGTPYKGIVPAKGFLTGTQLASMIGLTDGTAINDDAGWLHYIEDSGLELYIAKKPLRINTTWELINTAQGGNKKVVEVNGERYVVRFIAGNAGAYDYAWDRYILGVYNSADRTGFPAGVPYWGDYTASMLGVAVTNELSDGSHTICAEPDTSRGGYVCRGNGGSAAVRGVTANWYLPANTRYKHYGWRPMLVKESTIPSIPFKGEVEQKDFITDIELAAQLGVTGGSRINAGVQWLHFVFDKGPELYVAKKSMRSNLTWEFYNNLGLALGKRLIQIGDRYFKVRFILGADKEPANATLGREWMQLFPPLTNGTWANYLYSDLGVGTGTSNGELAMFQEISMRSDKAHAAGPYSGTSNLWYQPAGATNGGYGWRPVLELVKDLPVYPDSGPGPKVLMSGTEDLGYFGQVTATELFGAKDFLTRAAIAGTTLVASANTQVYTWLKFFFKRKVIYIAKIPFASGLTWENAYKAGLVYGERGTGLFPVAGSPTDQYRPMTKQDNGKTCYLVPRLIHGLAMDNYASKDDDQYAGSEWTELLGRTVIEANRPITEKWDNFFMVDIGSGGSEYTLGLETNRNNLNTAVYMTDPNSVVNRFTHRDSVSKTQNNLYYRPVLELVDLAAARSIPGLEKVMDMPVALSNLAAGASGVSLWTYGGQGVSALSGDRYRFDLEKYTSIKGTYGVYGWGGSCWLSGLWMLGGTDGTYKNTLYKLDTSSGSRSATGKALPGPVRGQVAMATIDNYNFHAVGGIDTTTGKTTALHYRYRIVLDYWTQLADLPQPMTGHSAGCYNGKFYVGGGWNETAGNLAEIYEYTPSTNSWAEITKCPAKTAWVGGGIFKNFFVLGANENGRLVLHVYDIDAQKWGRVYTTAPARWGAMFAPETASMLIVGGCANGNVGTDEYLAAPRFTDILRFSTLDIPVEELGPRMVNAERDGVFNYIPETDRDLVTGTVISTLAGGAIKDTTRLIDGKPSLRLANGASEVSLKPAGGISLDDYLEWTLEWTSLPETIANGSFKNELMIRGSSMLMGTRWTNTALGDCLQISFANFDALDSWRVPLVKTDAVGKVLKHALVFKNNRISYFLNGTKQTLQNRSPGDSNAISRDYIEKVSPFGKVTNFSLGYFSDTYTSYTGNFGAVRFVPVALYSKDYVAPGIYERGLVTDDGKFYKRAHPVFTGNVTDGYQATATSAYDNDIYAGFRALDFKPQNTDSVVVNNHPRSVWLASSPALPQMLSLSMPEAKRITGLVLRAYTTPAIGGGVVQFDIETSVDGVTWTKVYSSPARSNTSVADDIYRDVFDVTTRYIRMKVNTTQGSAYNASVFDMFFLERGV